MKKLYWLFLLLLFVPLVQSMDVSVVTGTKVNGDVFHDFGKTVLRVSPENSISLNKQHTQTIEVINKQGSDLYYFIDPYFENKDLSQLELYEMIGETKVFPKIAQDCSDKINYPHCRVWEEGTKTETVYSPKKVTTQSTGWGTDKHQFNTQGILIKNGETKVFQVKYTTITNKGKWNARVWANTISDYSCILDYKSDCIFDYVLDPSYDMSNLTRDVISYYKMDEATGTWIMDSNTSNDNGLTMGAGVTWTTGKIINATAYTSLATAIAVNSSVVNMPTTEGSVNIWVYSTSTADIDYMWEFDNNAGGERTAGYLHNGGNNIQMFIDGANAYFCPTNPLALNTWGMLTFYWKTTTDTYEIYINGTNVTGCTITPTTDSTVHSRFCTGNYCHGPAVTYGMTGRLDEVAIFSRKLTSDEMLGLYNGGLGCSYPFNCWDRDDTVTIVNQTYNVSVFETQNYQYTINVSWGANVSNITDMTLNAFNYSYTPTVLSNGTLPNQTWRQYIVSDVRPPLTITNNTAYQFNWTFTTRLDNGTNYTNSTTNLSQSVLWAYYPELVFLTNQIMETSDVNLNASYSIDEGNISNVLFNYLLEWNLTNFTGTYVVNDSSQINATWNFNAGFVNTTNIMTTATIRPYINLTFNGTTLVRNNSLTGTQQIYKMILNFTNATCGSPANYTAVVFSLRDLNESEVNGNVSANFTVHLFSGNTTYTRIYNYTTINDASPTLCMYPDSAISSFYVNWDMDVIGDGNRSASSTVSDYLLTNSSTLYPIYYGSQFLFYFLDEINNSILNGVNITAEFLGDDFTYNYTTGTGTLNAYLVVPQNYTLRFYASGYGRLRQYRGEFSNTSSTRYYLYMLQNSSSSDVTITVYDGVTLTKISNAMIYVQRFNLTSNSYKTVAMYETGVDGSGYFDLEFQNELYKFIVDYPYLTQVFVSSPMYVENSQINLYISTSDTTFENFFNEYAISGTITYSNSTGTPTMTVQYNDPYNSGVNYCFYLKKYGRYTKEVLNSSCQVASSGSLSLAGLETGGTVNYAVFTVNTTSGEKVIATGWKELPSTELGAGNLGIFLSIGIIITFFFLSWLHLYALLMGVTSIALCKLLGILPIDWAYIIIIIIAGVIITVVIQKK